MRAGIGRGHLTDLGIPVIAGCPASASA